MTDFWFNHFNVFLGKGPDRYLLTAYERDVIRPHALGKFKDLLAATAKSPAMLFYLDNWLSVGPHSQAALGMPQRPGSLSSRAVRHSGISSAESAKSQCQEKERRLERELRPRADGAAHTERQRRV